MKKCYAFDGHSPVTIMIRKFFAGLDAMRSKLSSLSLESVLAFRNVIRYRQQNLFFGNGRFLLRGPRGVRDEMALAVLAHQFKRMGNILGIPALMSKLAQAWPL